MTSACERSRRRFFAAPDGLVWRRKRRSVPWRLRRPNRRASIWCSRTSCCRASLGAISPSAFARSAGSSRAFHVGVCTRGHRRERCAADGSPAPAKALHARDAARACRTPPDINRDEVQSRIGGSPEIERSRKPTGIRELGQAQDLTHRRAAVDDPGGIGVHACPGARGCLRGIASGRAAFDVWKT